MDGDLTTLFIGAVIGILGSIVAYCVNHLLKLREQRFLREFEIREKGREFYHQIYGAVAVLSDYVTSWLQKDFPTARFLDRDKAMILTENGYVLKPKIEIIERYRESFEKYSKFWFESREKGLEIFIPKNMAMDLTTFWGFAGYFRETKAWDQSERLMKIFKEISQKICDDIDKKLGITEKKSRVPKWLNPTNWRRIIRSGKLERKREQGKESEIAES